MSQHWNRISSDGHFSVWERAANTAQLRIEIDIPKFQYRVMWRPKPRYPWILLQTHKFVELNTSRFLDQGEVDFLSFLGRITYSLSGRRSTG